MKTRIHTNTWPSLKECMSVVESMCCAQCGAWLKYQRIAGQHMTLCMRHEAHKDVRKRP